MSNLQIILDHSQVIKFQDTEKWRRSNGPGPAVKGAGVSQVNDLKKTVLLPQR